MDLSAQLLGNIGRLKNKSSVISECRWIRVFSISIYLLTRWLVSKGGRLQAMILEYQSTLKQQVNLLKYYSWLASQLAGQFGS